MLSPVIHDGYTLTGRIDPIGPFGPMVISYRPALPEEVLDFLDKKEKVEGKAQLKPIADFLVNHVKGWDQKDKDGNILPVTAEKLRTVHFGYLQAMLDHVMGYARAEAAEDVKNSAGG